MIRFTPVNESELRVEVEAVLNAGLHYQTPLEISFSTMTYAQSLDSFLGELENFQMDEGMEASYYGSMDMELRIRQVQGQADFAHRIETVCFLVYEPHQSFEGVSCDSRVELALGRVNNLEKCIEAIREMTSVMDCRGVCDLPMED